MNNVTLQNLVFDVLHSSPCRTEVDFIGYEERVRFLMENLIIKFDQDLEYQRDLEEQIDNLEVENIGLDKCIRRLSKDAMEAIDECRSEADGMAEKMISTVKLLQSENVQWQMRLHEAEAETKKVKVKRLAELQAMTAVATVFEAKLGYLKDCLRSVSVKEQSSTT